MQSGKTHHRFIFAYPFTFTASASRSAIFAFLLVCLTCIAVLTGCSNSTDALGEFTLQDSWQRHAVVDTGVTVLENDRESLLIGTETGLFKLQGDRFISLGLRNQEIVGGVRLTDYSLLVGVKTLYNSGNKMLFRSINEGESWQPYLNNYGGDEGKYTRINIGPITASFPSDTVFVGGGPVVRSFDGGENWEVVLRKWDSITGVDALFIDFYHTGYVWTGGISQLSEPYLWKSTDYGETWEYLKTIREVDGTITEGIVYDVITHPDDPDLVLAGLGGGFLNANHVKKSTDGGQNWQVVLDSTGVHTFTRSRDNPEVIYASGRDASTKLFFVKTSDFGETWKKEIFEEGPSVVTTNDLAVITVEGQEVLFLGTDQGLYSYTLGN